jgi:hypothetical protein
MAVEICRLAIYPAVLRPASTSSIDWMSRCEFLSWLFCMVEVYLLAHRSPPMEGRRRMGIGSGEDSRPRHPPPIPNLAR